MTGCLVWNTFSINGQLDPDVTAGVSNFILGQTSENAYSCCIESSALHACIPRAPSCCRIFLLSCHCQISFPIRFVARQHVSPGHQPRPKWSRRKWAGRPSSVDAMDIQ